MTRWQGCHWTDHIMKKVYPASLRVVENKDLWMHVFLIKPNQLLTFLERGKLFHISCGLHIAPITAYYFIHICLMFYISTLPHKQSYLMPSLRSSYFHLIFLFPSLSANRERETSAILPIYHLSNHNARRLWANAEPWCAAACCWPWHADKHTLSVWPHSRVTPLVLFL